jgi:hypothetical protein
VTPGGPEGSAAASQIMAPFMNISRKARRSLTRKCHDKLTKDKLNEQIKLKKTFLYKQK